MRHEVFIQFVTDKDSAGPEDIINDLVDWLWETQGIDGVSAKVESLDDDAN